MAEGSQATREQKRDELLRRITPPVEAPKPPQAAPTTTQMTPIRTAQREVKTQVETGVDEQKRRSANAAAVIVRGTRALLDASPGVDDQMRAADSELFRLNKIAQSNPNEVFKDCKVQYAYNQRQKIYSISAMLDNRPRIITERVGDNFMDISLADQKGNLLEVLRQEDTKGITFSKTG